MPLGFGSWISEANTGLELDMGPGPLESFGQHSESTFDGMGEFSMDYQY